MKIRRILAIASGLLMAAPVAASVTDHKPEVKQVTPLAPVKVPKQVAIKAVPHEVHASAPRRMLNQRQKRKLFRQNPHTKK